jgi:hypothetical protein
MSLEPLEYLRHMLAEADSLASATAGLTREILWRPNVEARCGSEHRDNRRSSEENPA